MAYAWDANRLINLSSATSTSSYMYNGLGDRLQQTVDGIPTNYTLDLNTDLTAVTPDAGHKTHFVLVDAVGVCEQEMTDTRPLERKKHLPFDKLLQRVAMGVRDADSLESLAGRLARLDRALTPKGRASVELLSGGLPLKEMIHNLLDSVDPDFHIEFAQSEFGSESPEAI